MIAQVAATDPFDGAPVIELTDPLAEVLGGLPPGGSFHYSYEDVVKLSGHSCPTVAGAFLMTLEAVRALYPDRVAERGQILVTMGGTREETGPMAQVIGFITGAAPETGFGGLMGKWKRRDLMRFDPTLDALARFERIDTRTAVDVVYDPSPVPSSPEIGKLLGSVLAGRASGEERRRLADLWQARVIDLVTGEPSRVVRVRPVQAK